MIRNTLRFEHEIKLPRKLKKRLLGTRTLRKKWQCAGSGLHDRLMRIAEHTIPTPHPVVLNIEDIMEAMKVMDASIVNRTVSTSDIKIINDKNNL